MSHPPPHSPSGLMGRLSTAFTFRRMTPRRSSLMVPNSGAGHASAVRREKSEERPPELPDRASDEQARRKKTSKGTEKNKQARKQQLDVDGSQWTGSSSLAATPSSPDPLSTGPLSPTAIGTSSPRLRTTTSEGLLANTGPSSGSGRLRRDTHLTFSDDAFSSPGASTPEGSLSLRAAVQMDTPLRLNDPKVLLIISDSVRGALAATKTLGPDGQALTQRLDAILASEVHNSNDMLDFETIMRARLDKLVIDLVSPTTRPSSGAKMGGRHFAAVTAAATLQKRWRVRFKERYFEMDELRYAAMLDTGRLRAVSFSAAPDEGIVIWTADQGQQEEADIQFVPGHWWLNVACAHRDGMVGSSFEKPTKGRYGIAVLPLLTGVEEVLSDLRSRYTRKSRNRSEMHFALLKQTGKRIRILRGYRLKSIHAPAGGVRYDGLYQIIQYSFKQDEVTELYHLEIILERASGQRPIDLLRRIPRPSQLDDWQLYERHEAEKVRLKEGEARFTDWKLRREAERADRAHWRRSREFGNSVATAAASAVANIAANAGAVAANAAANAAVGGPLAGPGGLVKSSSAKVKGGAVELKERRRSSVMLELPGVGGRRKIIDPKEEPTPPAV